MLRDITLGQYYQTDSILHKLDPRIKLIGTFWFIVALFLVKNFIGYAVALLFLAACIKFSHVPFKFIVKGMKSILILLLITMVFNLVLTPGRELAHLGPIKVTYEGLTIAAKMAIRLTMLIIGSSILTLTTTPSNLTDGMEKLFAPLKVFKVPVHEVARIMSIALQSGNLIQRAKSLGALLEPLFLSAFQRALDLAMAMEARCYRGGEGRTKMKPLVYAHRYYAARAIIYLFVIATVVLGRMNIGI